MQFLKGKENEEAKKMMQLAIETAKKSKCLRSKCGSIIVKDNKIIGSGWNSPPKDESIKECFKDSIPKDFKSDRSCCVHAEERAIMNALKNKPAELSGSRLYFIRLDLENNMLFAGEPFCTICSKLALDAGIKEFVLWHKEGICVYNTEEYNKLSFAYRRKVI